MRENIDSRASWRRDVPVRVSMPFIRSPILTGLASPSRLTQFVVASIVAAALVLSMFAAPAASVAPFRLQSGPALRVDNESSEADLERGFLPNPAVRGAHSASLVELPDGRTRAFWLDGKEGSPHAVISTAVYDPREGAWSMPATAADPRQTAQDTKRWVKKVGNAVAHASQDGRLTLFYVSVGIGGWAASAINTRISHDGGETWSAAARLVTSPFLNVSTLVRHPPVERTDGTLELPVYHEFVQKYADMLTLDENGRITGRQRLHDQLGGIQPQVVVEAPHRARLLMRNARTDLPRCVLTASTTDAATWGSLGSMPLPNPNSGLSSVLMPDGQWLVVLNDVKHDRRRLSLVSSTDRGATWRTVHVFEDEEAQGARPPERSDFARHIRSFAAEANVPHGDAAQLVNTAADAKCRGSTCDYEYSYPFLIRTRGGGFHARVHVEPSVDSMGSLQSKLAPIASGERRQCAQVLMFSRFAPSYS